MLHFISTSVNTEENAEHEEFYSLCDPLPQSWDNENGSQHKAPEHFQ